MKYTDRLGLRFIRASLHFIPTNDLYTIIEIAKNEEEEIKQREVIIKHCQDEIRDRENGKLYKIIRGTKEVWVERTT